MLEIYLIRHGETAWSKKGHHTGLTDIPLTEDGKKECRALYQKIKDIHFDTVYCSPLIRAKQTCEICHLLEKATISSDLLEWNYGDYEGMTSKQIHLIDPNWMVFSKDPRNGETSHQVEARADRMIGELLKLDGRVAIFSSGHFLRAFAARWLCFPVSYGMYFSLRTATHSILSFENGNQVIESWGIPPI
jgi:probable phosphoglycerate mutase